MKVLVINSDWGDNDYRKETNEYGGVGYYRLIQPLEHADVEYTYIGSNMRDYVDITSEESIYQSYLKLIEDHDIVLSKVIDNTKAVQTLTALCDYAKKPIVFDIDDNILEVKESQPAYAKGYYKGGKGRTVALTGISFANALFVSTEPLKEAYQKALKEAFDIDMPVYVLPNCNNKDDWQFESPKNTEKVVIGWHGSITHDEDLALVIPDINSILTEFPHVHLQLMGGVTKDTLKYLTELDEGVLDRVECTGGTKSWKGFPEALMSQTWDIGIAPLVNDDFNKGKSHIKWMELSMKGIPTVASNVYPYSEPIHGIPTIQDGKTGFLVEKDWYSTLKMLIEDPKLRKKVGKQAKEFVSLNWQYKDHSHLWEEALQRV